MNPRERLLCVLNHKKADHVPWFGDLDYWATSLVCRGEKPKFFIASDSYLNWHRELGVGFYLQGRFPFREVFGSCTVEEKHDNDVRIRRFETPVGVIYEEWKWLEDSFSEAPIKHLVETVEDLKVYKYIYSHLTYEPDYEFLERRKEQIGDYGVVLGYMPKSPLMQMIALDAGIMNTVFLEREDPKLFADVMDTMSQTIASACRITLDSPSEIIMIPENLSAEMVGPILFEKYMRGYQTRWAEAIRKRGKYSCIHMDGTLKGLLQEVCSVGLTFVEACTPAPVGNLAVEDWDWFTETSQTILWGGIPGSFFTPVVTDEEFINFVKSVLTVMKEKPCYVLGVADQVPPDAIAS